MRVRDRGRGWRRKRAEREEGEEGGRRWMGARGGEKYVLFMEGLREA